MKFDVCVIGGCSIDNVNYKNEINKNALFFGGKGANQAVASSRAGGKTCIISKVGNDKYCEKIIENLINNNVTTFIEKVNCNSDYTKIEIDENGDNHITRSNEAINTFTTNDIDKYVDIIKNSKYVLIQLKMPLNVTKYIIDLCNKLNVKVVLTPCPLDKITAKNMKNSKILDKVDFICANKNESQIIFNTTSVKDSICLAPNKLIATLGERGVAYFDGKQIQFIPALKIDKVVDSTGAGDTFCGNFVVNLAKGLNLKDAIVRSQYASLYKIQHHGAQEGMPTKNQLVAFIRKLNYEHEDFL